MKTIEQQYWDACTKAADRSAEEECTLHVYAMLGIVNGFPQITGFGISDWFDSATIATYTDGDREGL